jgi:diguanylate cyclase (GGDEF)-like protein
MKGIEDITRRVLLNLIKNKLDPTPRNYEKEFCKTAGLLELPIRECDEFQKLSRYLTQKELEKYNKPEVFYDLAHIFSKRTEIENIDDIIRLFSSALKPSVSIYLDNSLDSFLLKLSDNPALVLEKDIQNKIEKFTEKRLLEDQKLVREKTDDIAKLVILINDILTNAISTSTNGSSVINEIKQKIEAVDISESTKEDLEILQTTLVNAANDIENHMQSVSETFQSTQSEVVQLKQKVKDLEEELVRSHNQSEKDFLTQVFNRQAFEERLERFEQKFMRLQQNFAVVFFDLDHFKKVNDKYGHEAGDVVLQTFSSILMKLTRKIDVVARYGGEEFVSLVNYNDLDELYSYVQRIKRVINKHKFIYKEHKIHLTFSAGIELRKNCDDIYQAVSNADHLLYDAKHKGRNKIILWTGEEL